MLGGIAMLETLVLQCLLCAFGQAGGGGPVLPAVPLVSPVIPLAGDAMDGSTPAAATDPVPEMPGRTVPDRTVPDQTVPDRTRQTAPVEVPRQTDSAEQSPRPYRPTPPELVAEAMMLPPGHMLTGQPMTLSSVLLLVHDRTDQLQAIAAYWRLAEAVALYRFQLDYHRQLQDLVAGPNQAARLAAGRAASKAQLGRAELQTLAAQHEMAAYAGMTAESALPLPADQPHVGQYITRFRELFAGRPAPPAARRLDRTLPIRFQAIEVQAQAVAAAEDAYAALGNGADAQGRDLADRLAGLAMLHRQQSEWIRAVCRYNQEIAEYAVAVAPSGTNGAGLVGLLIRPGPDSVRPLVSDDASTLQPATMLEPIRDPATQPRTSAPAELPDLQGKPIPGARPMPGQPTPARRPDTLPPTEPTREPRANTEPDSSNLLPQRPVVPVDRQTLEGAPAGGDSLFPASRLPGASPLEEAAGAAPILDGGLTTSLPPGHVVRRPAAVLTPLYPGLTTATPGTQAKQLAMTLHWNRSLPEATEPVELVDCLRLRTGDRRNLIAAYWQAKQQAAAYQVWQQHRQWLEELSHTMAERPASAARVRAVWLAAEASVIAAQADLLDAQFRMAEEIGRSADAAWPVPATRPHAGAYLLEVASLPPDSARSQPLRRLVDTIPRLSASVWDHAAAVVEADAARAESEAAWLDGTAAMDEVLGSLDRQTGQTLDFLASLTTYNGAIAEYALSVLPADTPAEQLVKTLVMAE